MFLGSLVQKTRQSTASDSKLPYLSGIERIPDQSETTSDSFNNPIGIECRDIRLLLALIINVVSFRAKLI